MDTNSLIKNGHNGPVLSKFLTLEEQKSLTSSELKISFSNSYPNEERKRAFICPKNIDVNPDFKISFLQIKSKEELKHPSILGALMSLGITREVIGDIIVGEKVYILVCSEIEKYIKENLLTVGRSKVEVEVVSHLEDVDTNNYIASTITISSMRLDAIIGKSINLSREKAQELIRQRCVKINGNINTNNDYLCKQDDIISITHFGRIIVRDIARTTKKEKLVLNIERTK